jgi:hypothetical protein
VSVINSQTLRTTNLPMKGGHLEYLHRQATLKQIKTVSFQICTPAPSQLEFVVRFSFTIVSSPENVSVTSTALAPNVPKVARRRRTHHQRPLLSCGVVPSRDLPASTSKKQCPAELYDSHLILIDGIRNGTDPFNGMAVGD